MLDKNSKTFIMDMAIRKQEKMITNFIKKIYIKGKVRNLIFDKIFIAILVKYFNYNNMFSRKNIMKLPKYINNNYAIKLK